ncbi:PAS domain S-box protein [Nostoc sp. PCC 7107]|uniref:PAS domain S-box protein n=1 Tax=Nostoc sp. PCC 7107 TaxID=317936 RepID=UPI00029F4436|nr:PAS domain S-box protein [Nostoc sp. PCC 7107]AFY40900.1 multi-sensor hybrid histidine kinase [Nostoc sp. PCC 7107]
MPYIPYSQLLRYGFVVVIVATALVIMLLLDPLLDMKGTPFLLFFSAVMMSAWYGGLKAGLLATFLSVIVSDYFFLSEHYALSLSLSNGVKILLFAVQGLLFSFLCEELRHAKRKAEINLQKFKISEERFRVALSNSDIVVFQQDRNFRYQWVHNLQGIDKAEALLGKTDDELFPVAIAQQLTAIKRRAIEQDISAREEVCVILRGKVLYYDLLVEPLTGIDGGVTCVGVNITERKQTELEKAKLQSQLQQALQQKDESLALLNAWLMSSPMALAFLDTELRYVYANEALAAINGVPQNQHIGRTLPEVLPEWASQLEPIFQELMITKQPLLNQEISGETYPSGVYRYGLVSYYPVSLPDGQLLGVGITGVDITPVKKAEQALRESEAKFRSVVESNMIGIGFWEGDGRITDANEALLKMLGYSRQELVEKKLDWRNLTPVEYRRLDEQALTQFQENSFCTPYEKEYIRKDGSRFQVLVGGSCYEGTLERGAFFVIDITERKQAEDKLRYIAEISSLLSTSLDYEETLQQIAKISVPQLADWCIVDILEEDGSIRRLPVVYTDPFQAKLAQKLQEYVPNAQGTHLIARVLQTAIPKLIAEVSDSVLIAATQNEEHLEIVRQMGLKSVIVVPLIAHQRVLGCISFAIAHRCYDQADLNLAIDIAYRAALAVENAQLYRDNHQALINYAESLLLLDALLAGAPVAVCFLDRELRYVRINQVLADINGFPIEAHLGRKFGDIFSSMATQFEAQLQQVLETGEPLLNVEISGEMPGKPGVYGYWLGNYYPVRNALDETVGIGIMLSDVTATKVAEVALRESESRFRAMFNQAAVGIALVALNGKFLQVNPALCDITGYSQEELIQMSFQDITHPDDLAIDWEQAGRVLTKEISGYSLEKRYIRKDGSVVWVNLTSSAVWDIHGQAKYAVGIIEDISERQAALRDRQQAELAQTFLVEASSLLAASLDCQVTLNNVASLLVPTLADWCVVDVLGENDVIEQIAMISANLVQKERLTELRRRYPPRYENNSPFRETLLNKQSVFYPELPDQILAQMAEDEEHLKLLQSLGMNSLMIIPLHLRGKVFGVISLVRTASSSAYNSADLALAEDLAHRAATAIDNARLYQKTQQAKQAAELAVSRTVRLQKITAALSEAITPQQVADVVVNQGIAALGASAGSVSLLAEKGSCLKVVQATGYPSSVLDAWKSFSVTAAVPLAAAVRTGTPIFIESPAAFAANYPHLAELPSVTGNSAFACIPLILEKQVIGALGLSFSHTQIFSEADQGFMLTLGQQCAQAIARAQLYEAERHARSEAETANRIKDEFLAVLSHELRTPLNPILGWAKLLRTRKNDEATIVRALETIERNAKLQAQLIEDLLDVSRILRGKLSLHIRTVDLNSTMTAALETVRLAAEAKSIQLQTVLPQHKVEVMGDGDRLQQIVWNLVSNAVKFTPAEGRVEVRLAQVGMEAQIQVIDNGKGITPEFLPYVFEYFRQADGKTTRVFGGLGLGLAIVRHLVELHGGTVFADSPGEEQGAIFTVRLPLHKSTESVSTANSVQMDLATQDSLLAGVRILFVDDQADVLEFFSFALEQYGAEVTAVASAAEALEALVKLQPDILLSDIGMPIMDGYMLLRQVRQLPPDKGGEIPAIALTAYAGEIDYKQAMAAGFQRHIPKPVDPLDLAMAIVQLISQK